MSDCLRVSSASEEVNVLCEELLAICDNSLILLVITA